MISIKEIKKKARVSLEDNLFGNVWLLLIVVSLICTAALSIPFVSLILGGAAAYASARIYVKVVRGNKKIDLNDLLCGVNEDFTATILLGVLRTLFIFLWSLLLIVPGIVKSYAYSMSSYIQQDSDDKDWSSCLDRSSEMMKGYKWKLFVLDLSFIGWYIVGFICFGIGTLWVSVYHAMARAHFYEELKALKDPAAATATDDDGRVLIGEVKE